eukprot:scaffold1404_cov166-Amphora_coffeaeformis.AAC.19
MFLYLVLSKDSSQNSSLPALRNNGRICYSSMKTPSIQNLPSTRPGGYVSQRKGANSTKYNVASHFIVFDPILVTPGKAFASRCRILLHGCKRLESSLREDTSLIEERRKQPVEVHGLWYG